MGISKRGFVFGASALFANRLSVSEARDLCPGVNARTGTRMELSSPPLVPVLPDFRPVPAQWREVAMNLIALFESGSRDPNVAYTNVSTTDEISIGYLQWNHNSGSLYSRLLKDSGEEIILAAPALIRKGIEVLVDIAAGRRPKREGLEVINSWKMPGGSFRPNVKLAVQKWLVSDLMKARQDRLVDQRLSEGLRYADAWRRDFGDAKPGEESQRAFYSFVDLQVFNGDLAGLWTPHVKTFRSKFKDGLEMINYISDWVSSCVSYNFVGVVETNPSYKPRFRKLYRRNETPISVAEWRRLIAEGDVRINDDALNLIALGYLRAIVSVGADRPNGFHGVFELDVLNRRGMMATGVGALPGTTEISELFKI